jgi:hypothetical protein
VAHKRHKSAKMIVHFLRKQLICLDLVAVPQINFVK